MTEPWWKRVERAIAPQRAKARAKAEAVRVHWDRVTNDPDYRTAYEVALRVRGYKAAGHAKNHTQWPNSSPRSADGEINGDLYTMRNRSRAANRDDALSSGITGTLIRGVIGTGLRPQARTGDDAKDEALEAVWKRRQDELSLGEGNLIHGMVQRMRYGKVVEDGEIFLRPAIRMSWDANGMPGYPAPGPLWIENIEADRVRTPADAEPRDPAGRIINGIEKDRDGVVTAYWILNKHPGDTVLWDTKLGSKAIPFASTFSIKYFNRCSAESVCHIRSRVTRPGQSRGVPTCHAIMQDLRDLDLLILASLKRTQVAACLAVFLTSTVESTDLIELTAEDYGYQLEQKIEPGSMFRLFPGEKAEFLNPTAGVPDLDKFVFLLARRIGSAIGLSPQAILRAWEGVSYSGARTIKTDDRQTYRGERADFAGHALKWEWKVVFENELLMGNPELSAVGITLDDIDCVDWVGDEEPWVDPQAEASSIETMLQLKLTSPQIECARLGRDFTTVMKEILQAEMMERDLRVELGLPEAGAMAAGTQDAFGNDITPAVSDANPAFDSQPKPKKTKGRSIFSRAAGPVRSERDEVMRALFSPPDVIVNVPEQKIVNNIQLPEQAPIAFNPRFEVSMPDQPAAINRITVTPDVVVNMPEIKISLPKREFKFAKDKNGNILGAVAEDKS